MSCCFRWNLHRFLITLLLLLSIRTQYSVRNDDSDSKDFGIDTRRWWWSCSPVAASSTLHFVDAVVLSKNNNNNSNSNKNGNDADFDLLQTTLADVSLFERRAVDGYVTLMFANRAYMDDGFVQNLVCSFRRLAVKNWVLVAVDSDAYDVARKYDIQQFTHFDAAYWHGVGGESLRNSSKVTDVYLQFIHRRTNFVRLLLYATKLNVIITDADSVKTTQNSISNSLGFRFACQSAAVGLAARSGVADAGVRFADQRLSDVLLERSRQRPYR
jgi:hypothetical protein